MNIFFYLNYGWIYFCLNFAQACISIGKINANAEWNVLSPFLLFIGIKIDLSLEGATAVALIVIWQFYTLSMVKKKFQNIESSLKP